MSERGRLSITRRPGETFDLHFAGDVTVTVTVRDVRGRNVRHLIEAPPSVVVIRDDASVVRNQNPVGRRIHT